MIDTEDIKAIKVKFDNATYRFGEESVRIKESDTNIAGVYPKRIISLEEAAQDVGIRKGESESPVYNVTVSDPNKGFTSSIRLKDYESAGVTCYNGSGDVVFIGYLSSIEYSTEDALSFVIRSDSTMDELMERFTPYTFQQFNYMTVKDAKVRAKWNREESCPWSVAKAYEESQGFEGNKNRLVQLQKQSGNNDWVADRKPFAGESPEVCKIEDGYYAGHYARAYFEPGQGPDGKEVVLRMDIVTQGGTPVVQKEVFRHKPVRPERYGKKDCIAIEWAPNPQSQPSNQYGLIVATSLMSEPNLLNDPSSLDHGKVDFRAYQLYESSADVTSYYSDSFDVVFKELQGTNADGFMTPRDIEIHIEHSSGQVSMLVFSDSNTQLKVEHPNSNMEPSYFNQYKWTQVEVYTADVKWFFGTNASWTSKLLFEAPKVVDNFCKDRIVSEMYQDGASSRLYMIYQAINQDDNDTYGQMVMYVAEGVDQQVSNWVSASNATTTGGDQYALNNRFIPDQRISDGSSSGYYNDLRFNLDMTLDNSGNLHLATCVYFANEWIGKDQDTVFQMRSYLYTDRQRGDMMDYDYITDWENDYERDTQEGLPPRHRSDFISDNKEYEYTKPLSTEWQNVSIQVDTRLDDSDNPYKSINVYFINNREYAQEDGTYYEVRVIRSNTDQAFSFVESQKIYAMDDIQQFRTNFETVLFENSGNPVEEIYFHDIGEETKKRLESVPAITKKYVELTKDYSAGKTGHLKYDRDDLTYYKFDYIPEAKAISEGYDTEDWEGNSGFLKALPHKPRFVNQTTETHKLDFTGKKPDYENTGNYETEYDPILELGDRRGSLNLVMIGDPNEKCELAVVLAHHRKEYKWDKANSVEIMSGPLEYDHKKGTPMRMISWDDDELYKAQVDNEVPKGDSADYKDWITDQGHSSLDIIHVSKNGWMPYDLGDKKFNTGYVDIGNTVQDSQGDELSVLARYKIAGSTENGFEEGFTSDPNTLGLQIHSCYLRHPRFNLYDAEDETVLAGDILNHNFYTHFDTSIKGEQNLEHYGKGNYFSDYPREDTEIAGKVKFVDVQMIASHLDFLVDNLDTNQFIRNMDYTPSQFGSLGSGEVSAGSYAPEIQGRLRGLRVDMMAKFEDTIEDRDDYSTGAGLQEINQRNLSEASGKFAVGKNSELIYDTDTCEFFERAYFGLSGNFDGLNASLERLAQEAEVDSELEVQRQQNELFINNLIYERSENAETFQDLDHYLNKEAARKFFVGRQYRVTNKPVPEGGSDLGENFPIAYGILRKVPMLHAIAKNKAPGRDYTVGDDFYVFAENNVDVDDPSDVTVHIDDEGQDNPTETLNAAAGDELIQNPFPNKVENHYETVTSDDAGQGGLNPRGRVKKVGTLMYPYHDVTSEITREGNALNGIRLQGDEWSPQLGKLDKRYPIRNGVGSSKLYASFNGQVDDTGEIIDKGQVLMHPLDILLHYAVYYAESSYELSSFNRESIERVKSKTSNYRASVFIQDELGPVELMVRISNQFGIFWYVDYNGQFSFRLGDIDPDRVNYDKPITDDVNLLHGSQQVVSGYKDIYNQILYQYNKDYMADDFQDIVNLNYKNNKHCAAAHRAKGQKDQLSIEADYVFDSAIANDVVRRRAKLVSAPHNAYEIQVIQDRYRFQAGEIVPMFSREQQVDAPVLIKKVQPEEGNNNIATLTVREYPTILG